MSKNERQRFFLTIACHKHEIEAPGNYFQFAKKKCFLENHLKFKSRGSYVLFKLGRKTLFARCENKSKADSWNKCFPLCLNAVWQIQTLDETTSIFFFVFCFYICRWSRCVWVAMILLFLFLRAIYETKCQVLNHARGCGEDKLPIKGHLLTLKWLYGEQKMKIHHAIKIWTTFPCLGAWT